VAENRVSIDVGGVAVGATDSFGNPQALSVSNGQTTAWTTLNAATGNATGTALDCQSSHQVTTFVAVGTGTLAGTLTLEMSLDNTTWVSSGTTLALTAALTGTATSTGKAARYYRVSLSGATGTGTVTVKMMANG
jgi:hypothetical protein